MTLKTRRDKINKTVQRTREIYRRGVEHRVYSVKSPTSFKPYQVTTDWIQTTETKCGLVLSVKCSLFDFEAKSQPHIANYSRYICCQFLAAVKWAAKKVGKIVSFCESYQDAKRLLNFGGQLVKVMNSNGAVIWGTVR